MTEARSPVHPHAKTSSETYLAMSVELAPMVRTWSRMLEEHVTNDAGRCSACTRGGTGMPGVPWPCGLWIVAELASRRYIATQRARGPG